MSFNINLRGYRTFIAAALTAIFGALAAVDWGGVLSGNFSAGVTAISVAVIFAIMRSITSTPPGQPIHPAEVENKPQNT